MNVKKIANSTFFLFFFLIKLSGQDFKSITISEIVPKLFDGTWVESKQECVWKPNFAESLLFDYYLHDDKLVHTQLDTVLQFFKGEEKMVLLILSTQRADEPCHFCAPEMSLALLSSPKKEEEWTLIGFKKSVENIYDIERLYDTIEILQIGESDFCLKLSHFTSFNGAERYSQTRQTLYYLDESFKKTLSFLSSGGGAIPGKNRKYYDFSTQMKVDIKNRTVTLQEKGGKSNFDIKNEKIIKINRKIIYQLEYDTLILK